MPGDRPRFEKNQDVPGKIQVGILRAANPMNQIVPKQRLLKVPLLPGARSPFPSVSIGTTDVESGVTAAAATERAVAAAEVEGHGYQRVVFREVSEVMDAEARDFLRIYHQPRTFLRETWLADEAGALVASRITGTATASQHSAVRWNVRNNIKAGFDPDRRPRRR